MSKICFLFSGQSSQSIGMGKLFYNNYSSAKEIFEEANEVLQFNLRELCFNGDISELTKTENTQPALLTVSVIMFKAYMEDIGVMPQYLAGHSIGEISAVTCGGGLKFADAIKIVRKRGELMMRAVPPQVGKMCSISEIDNKTIEEECLRCSNDKEVAVISNYNSPNQTIISGNSSCVEKVCKNLAQKGAIIAPLNVSSAFHSPLMRPIIEDFSNELSSYQYYDMKIPVISNVSAQPYYKAGEIKDKLIVQVERPVMWRQSMDYLYKQGIKIAIEFGPKSVLKNLMMKNTASIAAYSYDQAEDREFLRKTLQTDKGKNSKMELINMCLAAAVCIKNNNWNIDDYHKGVITPYQKIKEMRNVLVAENSEPSVGQVKEAVEMLKSVLLTKQVPTAEQQKRLNPILEKTIMII